MKAIKIIILFQLGIGLFYSCKSTKTTYHKNETFKPELSVFQNGIEYTADKVSNTLILDKQPFSLRFNNKKYSDQQPYTTQIVASTDATDLKLLKRGKLIDSIPKFGMGTGLAANVKGPTEFFIDYNGHNYLFYKNEKVNRLHLLEENDGIMRFEFPINTYIMEGKEKNITALDADKLYLIVLTDVDQNDIVNKGEFQKLIIRFK